MKKVLAIIAGFVFAAFSVGIIALLMTLTYQALGRIFPNNFQNQMWGMTVFDIAVICWALAFVYKSKSVVQYAATGTGFLVALVGTLAMVAAEVILSGNNVTPEQLQKIGQWMVYGFIGVTVLHVIMLWVHHGAAPEIWSQIDLGISKSQVTDAARKQATDQIEKEQSLLANDLASEIVSQIKRDLNISIAVDPNVGFVPRQYPQAIPHPVEVPAIKDKATQPPSPLVKAVNKLTAPFRSQASAAPKNGASVNADAANGSNPPLVMEKPQSTPPTASESLEIKTCSYCGRSQEQTFSKFRASNWLWKYTDEHGTITICDACNQEGTPQRKSYLSA